MSDQSSTHYGLTRILRETFTELDLTESTRLVGVLYESQILILGATWVLPALEPKEAARFIADLYGQNAHRVFQRFQQNWSSMKHSPATTLMIESLKAHELVDKIVPFHSSDSQTN